MILLKRPAYALLPIELGMILGLRIQDCKL